MPKIIFGFADVAKHVPFGIQRDIPLDYTQHVIPKPHGGTRTVYAPNEQLRVVQNLLLVFFSELVEERMLLVHPAATGRLSAYENASRHAGAKRLSQFDIKDFFASITYLEVVRALSQRFTQEAAETLARLTTIQMIAPDKGRLPQRVLAAGAPTSSLLADLVCEPLDEELEAIGLTYTRYVDDITFSSNAFEPFIGDVEAVAARYGFALNDAKTRFSGPGNRLLVTGFNIDEAPGLPSVRAPRNMWRRLRAVVCNLERDPSKELHELANGLCAHVEQTDKDKAKPYRDRIAKVFTQELT